MTQTQIAIGASASCTDEAAGHVIRVVVNPAGLTVTHLVVGPKRAHGHHIHRLVPVDLTEITTDGIRLSCTKAEFDKLDPAEETHFEEVWEHPAYEPNQVWCRRRTVTYDSVLSPAEAPPRLVSLELQVRDLARCETWLSQQRIPFYRDDEALYCHDEVIGHTIVLSA